jgi:hypothetical protein
VFHEERNGGRLHRGHLGVAHRLNHIQSAVDDEQGVGTSAMVYYIHGVSEVGRVDQAPPNAFVAGAMISEFFSRVFALSTRTKLVRQPKKGNSEDVFRPMSERAVLIAKMTFSLKEYATTKFMWVLSLHEVEEGMCFECVSGSRLNSIQNPSRLTRGVVVFLLPVKKK